jgi:hypothetical protein
MPQAVLGALAQTSAATVCRIESGDMEGSPTMLRALSDATRRTDAADWLSVDDFVRWIPPTEAITRRAVRRDARRAGRTAAPAA